MKVLIIKTVGVLLYLAWCAVLLVGLGFMFVGNFKEAMFVLIGGWLGCLLVIGVFYELFCGSGKK